ncbi:Cu(I)-responsive transcriptional regulator [Amnimonas aquatica]|uniref:Cu(I)-responsive transcriptional regulator n=1 Tax=Amnimonas aquatica TaxID=2094561 RepID=A0A2P6ARS5_9GAMM|nr:Cu(I)-responsive transcriptional regulator [Amnimonas aquatica]PQA39058.1 Cu(I)-responsive transcriptional regulator [Amnimonas aquatica]
MNIGAAARATGLSAKMIRYYEDIGLLPASPRTASGYRHYSQADLDSLRFVRHARELGFPIDSIRGLMSLWQDPTRSSADVKALVLRQVADLDARIADLGRMRDAIAAMADCCHGDARPECPILDQLRAPDPPG